MAKIKYRQVHLSQANKERLQVINKIIEYYNNQDLVLTLRQLYYQLVTKNIIPNKVSEYAKLSNLLKEGRMGGVVDWDAIEDRLRKPNLATAWDSPADIIKSAAKQFQLPRMKGQEKYVEVWVEKDALSGVLSRVTKPFHVPLMVNRGYSSVSAMHDSFERFHNKFLYDGVESCKILYLGDFDPSGKDMIRDIEDRIKEFFNGLDLEEYAENFYVEPIALTEEQIKKYNPPPNPAKLTDPRAAEYIRKYGEHSWEVDALNPEVLDQIVRIAILDYIDEEKFDSIVEQEEQHRKKILALADKL